MRHGITRRVIVLLAAFLLSGSAVPAGDGTHDLEGVIDLGWEDRFASLRDDDHGAAIAVSPDGSTVFVAGRIAERHGTLAYDAATGERRWTSWFGSTPTSTGYGATALVPSPNGSRVYVAGNLWSPDLNFRFSYGTVAYDATSGATLWRDQYDFKIVGNDLSRAIAVSPDGSRVFVTGRSNGPGFLNTDYATLGYLSDSGFRLWERRQGGAPLDPSQDDPAGLVVSPDGQTIVVAGRLSINRQFDFGTVAYDPIGRLLWADRYHAGGQDQATALAMSPDGARVYVTGSSSVRPLEAETDWATLAYDTTTGARLWVRRFDGPAGGADEPRTIAVSADGARVFVSGASAGLGSGESDVTTVAYDAVSGDEVWVARLDGPASARDEATASALGGGVLVVVGSQESGTAGADFAAIAYETETGQALWSARYDGPQPGSDDVAAAVALDPGSQAFFVTGTSGGEVKTISYVMPLVIAIDIVPGNTSNPVRVGSLETVPVALLGGPALDVTVIDPESLRFGPAGARPAAEPAYTPGNAGPDDVRYLLPDINRDGYDDVIVSFVTAETGIACGDTSATLSGETRNARRFSGTDAVAPVGCD